MSSRSRRKEPHYITVTDFTGETGWGGGQDFVASLLGFLRSCPDLSISYAGFGSDTPDNARKGAASTRPVQTIQSKPTRPTLAGLLGSEHYFRSAVRLISQLSALRRKTKTDIAFANNLIDPFLLRLWGLRTEVMVVFLHHAESERFFTQTVAPRTLREAILRIVCRGSLAYWARHSRLGLIAQNPTQFNQVSRDSLGLVVQIPAGLDLSRFSGITARPRKNRILYVGRMNEREKRVSLLIEAHALVRDSTWELVLVGDGPDLPGYVDLVGRLGTEDRVRFLGHVSNSEVAMCLSESRIFVSPSVSESLGYNVLEAMAAGLPVVAVRNNGSMSTLVDGISGFIVEPDKVDLARALSRLIHDSKLRDRLGCAASSRVQTVFSRARAFDRIWEFSTSMLGERDRDASVNNQEGDGANP